MEGLSFCLVSPSGGTALSGRGVWLPVLFLRIVWQWEILERILTDGKIDPKKLKPITYDPVNNTYIGLGEVAGKAFGDGMQLK